MTRTVTINTMIMMTTKDKQDLSPDESESDVDAGDSRQHIGATTRAKGPRDRVYLPLGEGFDTDEERLLELPNSTLKSRSYTVWNPYMSVQRPLGIPQPPQLQMPSRIRNERAKSRRIATTRGSNLQELKMAISSDAD